jgi:DNA polymerase-4
LPPNPTLTERAWRALSVRISRYTPLWEPFRPGHIYLDVTGTERLWGRAKDTAGRVRREIQDQLRLSGTVGVAGNKMVSSIASKIIPSADVLDVDHGQESSFMGPLKVGVLPGIGHVRKRMLLEELNITLVREVAAMDMEGLRLVFGRQSALIHQRALGIDPTPVYPPAMKPTINEEITFDGDENDDRVLLGGLYRLVEKCSHRLRERALVPRSAGLMIRYADQEEAVRRVRFPFESFWDMDLYSPLERIFFEICQRRVRVRFMRVWFQDLAPMPAQFSLFPKMSSEEEKEVLATRALDHIREKYGDTAITYARAA